MIVRLIALGAIVVILFSGSVVAETDSVNIAYAGSTLWSLIRDVAVRGNYAFCASQHGLMVYDVSDYAQPEFTAKYYLEYGTAVSIEISGDYAYICGDRAGLIVFDISNPADPLLIGQYQEEYWRAENIALDGNHAYVTGSYDYIKVFDIGDPANPAVIYEFDRLSGMREIIVSGNLLYCGTYHESLIYDVTDPSAPDSLSSFSVPGANRSLGIKDSLAFIISDSVFYVATIADPANPAVIGQVALGFSDFTHREMVIIGDYVYSSHGDYDDGEGGILVIDISDPLSPEIARQLTVDSWSLSNLGDKFGASDLQSFYMIMDVTDPVNPVELGQFDIPHTRSWGFRGVITDGNYAYMAFGPSDLYIVDVSDPYNMRPVKGDFLNGGAYELARRGNYLYVASGSYDDNGLYIFDISNPESPLPISYYYYGSPQEITLHGDYAFMAGNSGTSIILDISDPYNPTLVSDYRAGGITWGVAVKDNYAYLANFNGLVIVNIADIENPLVVDTLDDGNEDLYDAIIYKDYLVTAGNGRIKVRDISMPSTPVDVTVLSMGGDIKALTPYGNYIFAAGPFPSFTILDMTDPTAPEIIGSHTISGQVQDVAFFDEYAFVIDQYGLMSYHVDLPACCNSGGDANFDGNTDIGDAIYLVNFVFEDGLPINCRSSADVNNDCIINIGDAVTLINYIFRNGPEPLCSDCVK